MRRRPPAGGAMRLVTTPRDLLRVRFAASPLWETVNAVRAFVDPRARPYLRSWWAAVSAAPPAPELVATQTRGRYSPDFLCQPPSGGRPFPRVADQLDAVRATPPALVAEELRRCHDAQGDPTARELIDAMLADPEAARDRLAGHLHDAWRRLVLPWWGHVRELVEADIDHRSRLLADRGLGHVIDGLHERIHWTGEAIVMRSWHGDAVRELGGAGLVLMPSAFVWPAVAAGVDEPWQPTLSYPARGIGELLGDRPAAPAALDRLLGRSRALLLADVTEPVSTTVLAARHRLSPGGVSAHLSALYDAGLVAKRRHRHEVLYRRTALGEALLAGAPAGGEVLPGE